MAVIMPTQTKSSHVYILGLSVKDDDECAQECAAKIMKSKGEDVPLPVIVGKDFTSNDMMWWAISVVKIVEDVHNKRAGPASSPSWLGAYFKHACINMASVPDGFMRGLMMPMGSDDWHEVPKNRSDASDARVCLLVPLAPTSVLMEVIDDLTPAYIDEKHIDYLEQYDSRQYTPAYDIAIGTTRRAYVTFCAEKEFRSFDDISLKIWKPTREPKTYVAA